MCQDCEVLREKLTSAEREIQRLQSALELADALRNRERNMKGVRHERADGVEPGR